VAKAQEAFHHRAWCNSKARFGKYTEEMETAKAAQGSRNDPTRAAFSYGRLLAKASDLSCSVTESSDERLDTARRLQQLCISNA
jgi:hypothetical protein